MRAIEAASDALYGRDGDVTPEQRRADAVGLLAERALAAGFADGPVSGSRAERYQVVLHVEPGALQEHSAEAREQRDVTGDVSAEVRGGSISVRDVSSEARGGSISVRDVSAETSAPEIAAGQPPVARLADGVSLCAGTARRLACDASVVVVARAPAASSGGTSPGAVLDVRRRTRTIPPALRRALEVRDGGCRYPGCASRFTDAHHIEHWADGGQTRLENLLLLCRRHHRAVHEGRARVCRGADDSIAFFGPDGRVLSDAPHRSLAARNGPAGRYGTAEPNGTHSGAVERVRPARADEVRLDLPSYRTGAARWACDGDVPLGIEVCALQAVEKAAGWA
jgi:hypothetical protein